MAHPLRDRGTPRALAESRQAFDFKGSLSDLERLLRIVEADLESLSAADRPAHWRQAPFSVRVSFGFADVRETVPAMTGAASVELDAVCQRCLEPFTLPLEVKLEHVLLAAGEQTDGFDAFEAWEMTESTLRPLDLVEEALIMALPLSAVHGSADQCSPLAGRVAAAELAESAAGDTVKPFADLKARFGNGE